MDEHRLRGTNWGTEELLDLLLAAAGDVASRFPGSLLPVGNIGKGGGGDIPWSISHNAGRDVDVAFYLLDPAGAPVLLPTIVELVRPLGTVLWNDVELTFDPARNWTFVRSLLERGGERVQYVFCAEFLIRRMFEYAVAHGEDPKRLKELRPRLRQPKGTQPHNDHFHIRIMCSEEDLALGCRDIVQGEEIVPRGLPAYQRQVRGALAVLDDGSETAPRKGLALQLLAILRAPMSQNVAWSQLVNCVEPVCIEALRFLDAARVRVRPSQLIDVVRKSDDPETVRLAFRLLRRALPEAADQLTPLLSDPRCLVRRAAFFEQRVCVRAEACHALGHLGAMRHGAAMAGLLSDPEVEVRSAALWALRALAGTDVFPTEAIAAPMPSPEQRWKDWLPGHRDVMKNLRAALIARGYRVKKLDRRDGPELVRAILDDDHLSLHVQRRLRQEYRSNIPISLLDKPNAQWLWKKELYRQKH
jgi:HEAT repeat protein